MLYRLVQRFFAHEEGVDGMSADGIAAMMEMAEYFAALAVRRRAAGTEGAHPLDVLIDFEQNGRRFADKEIASNMSLVLIGGSETFPKVFANLARRLAEHPSQRAAVAADPGLAPDAMVEALRYDMPTQFLGRTLVRDVELHGEKLRAGADEHSGHEAQPSGAAVWRNARRSSASFFAFTNNPGAISLSRAASQGLVSATSLTAIHA
jgi:cytochrome P450